MPGAALAASHKSLFGITLSLFTNADKSSLASSTRCFELSRWSHRCYKYCTSLLESVFPSGRFIQQGKSIRSKIFHGN